MNAKEYYKKSDQILKKYHNGLRKLEERTYLSLVETASEITLIVQILETEKYKELISPKLRKLLLEWVGNKNKALASLEKEVEKEDLKKMSIQDLINRTKAFNEKSFVNGQNELIIFPKINLFFRLDDVKSELDFKCKVLEWCSREADKGCTYFYRLQARHYINYILNTEFTANQFQMIYCQLGNCIDHKLTVDFITSNYDLNLLVSPHCKECLGNCLKEAK